MKSRSVWSASDSSALWMSGARRALGEVRGARVCDPQPPRVSVGALAAAPGVIRIARLPAAILSLATVIMALAGCGKEHESHGTSSVNLPVAQVQVQAAQIKKQATTEEVVGTIRAKKRAALEAKVSGRIEKMPVLLGQHVKAGQLVARLNAAEINARLAQAQASLEQAERDWKRMSVLFEGQAATRSESDTAEARLRLAKAAVAEAEAMMGYVEVLAPFDAVVTRKWADVGDFATPGKPLMEIEDPSALQLDADVPETIAPRIQHEARLAVWVSSVSGELLGQVTEIAPSADPGSRTLRVKLDLPQRPGVMSGQFARLLVPVGENTSLYVPGSSLVQRGQLEMVFVATKQRAQLRLVKTGKRAGDLVEILSGLEAGDPVITQGAALLTDGQPVEVK